MPALRHTEARHDALRAASDGRLSFQSGMALSRGSYWVTLPGMPEDEKTTSPRLRTAVEQLLAGGYLRHEFPGVPHRSGQMLITETGLNLLEDFDAKTANA